MRNESSRFNTAEKVPQFLITLCPEDTLSPSRVCGYDTTSEKPEPEQVKASLAPVEIRSRLVQPQGVLSLWSFRDVSAFQPSFFSSIDVGFKVCGCNRYRTTRTKQSAWCTTRLATLPSRNRLIALLPLWPTTIRSTSNWRAAFRIW